MFSILIFALYPFFFKIIKEFYLKYLLKQLIYL